MKSTLILIFFSINLFAQNSSSTLETYCKVWGLCKYYTNTNDTDWDEVFFNHYKDLIHLENNKALNIILGQLIQQTHLKKTTFVIPRIESNFNITNFYKLRKKHKTLVLKTDFSWINNSTTISKENKQLLRLLLKMYKGKKPKTTALKNQVISHNKEKIYKEFNHKIALLAFFRFYNVIEYYYPYKHLLDNDWNSVLSKMTPIFLNCNDPTKYKNALKLLSSYLQDSHVFVDFKTKTLINTPDTSTYKEKYPISLNFTDKGLFISNLLNDSISDYYNIKSGDNVTKINNENLEALINKFSQNGSYSRKVLSLSRINIFLHQQDTLNLTINDETILLNKVKMNQYEFHNLVQNNKFKYGADEREKKIDQDIGYIYLPSSKYFKVDNVFRKCKHKKTIILDCRGYGTTAALKLPRLLNKNKMDVASIYLPTKKYPGVFKKNKNETYYFSNTLDVIGKYLLGYKNKIFPTFNTPYKGNIIVLIDDNAISFGETVIMILKAYAKNIVLIGRPTIGANGNVTTLKLPLGEELYYSGVDFRFADGTEIQRQGIQPDIYVPTTLKGRKSEEDEILNAALKYIKYGRTN
jgi:C-terminal processing protease CtpA/Prc